MKLVMEDPNNNRDIFFEYKDIESARKDLFAKMEEARKRYPEKFTISEYYDYRRTPSADAIEFNGIELDFYMMHQVELADGESRDGSQLNRIIFEVPHICTLDEYHDRYVSGTYRDKDNPPQSLIVA